MNRLGREPSPYLRQHAGNPVDWYPWGEEALERARKEDKPILLSVGYSACHWCHVMAHESFEDPAIAARMNELFVNVKLDREERPDLDQLYQGVVQLMGRGGGWPLTVFLTPDLRPFFGGTYFPPADRYGMPGFPKLLASLGDAWKNRRQEVEQQAEAFREGLGTYASYGLDADASELSAKDVVSMGRRLGQEVDSVYGGFGGAPKFPNPMNVALLLRAYRRGATELWDPVSLTLERMALGGVYDQLGGGFHRYSTDARWLIPHFEKMLYDNAQLIHLYSEAQQIRPRPLWKRVVEETVAYVGRELMTPEGGFCAAQDADSEGEEGKFFAWTREELEAVLSKEQLELAERAFVLTGNFEGDRIVFELRADPEPGFAEVRRRLFEARSKRVRPGRDDKVLAGWNGLMIRGLAFASRVFGRAEWGRLAATAADFLLQRMWRDGRLARAWQDGQSRIDGFVEDYGDVALGLCAVYQATFEPRFLEAAEAIARRAVELFWDEGKQAYFSAPKGQKDLLCPTYALHDNAYPSGASTLTDAQVALAALLSKPEYLEQADRYLRKLRDPMVRNPFAYGHLALAGDALLDGAADVVLAGEAVEPLLAAVNASYAPTVAVSRRQEPGPATASLCRRFACEAPLRDPAALRHALETVSNR